jgi:hypothetical protein
MTTGSRARAALLHALRTPESLRSIEPARWEALLREADAQRLAGRLAWDAYRVGLAPDGWLGDRLTGLRIQGAGSDRAIRWEFQRILETLLPLTTRVLALKGAAYVLLDLPFARGRRVADVDVLVPAGDLGRVEAALVAGGWAHAPLDPYDDRYYRLWTHELPPMAHGRRLVPLDMHHGLVPRTSRIRPDPARVLTQSVALEGGGYVPSPPHLAIHAAVHLFHDGEIAGALRDLVDLDGLFRHFGATPSFWTRFCDEAEAMDASRASFYAVRYARRVLQTPVPADVVSRAARWAPGRGPLAAMDYLVERALVWGRAGERSIAGAALRTRAHWLRMPPGLLLRHLAVKTARRWRGDAAPS